MLKYKKGDLIKAAQNGEVDVIAHQCNCFNNMGSGIAPQIAKAFPTAQTADNNTIKGDESKLGRLSYAIEDDTFIFNLYGQFGWWRCQDGKINTDYKALKSSFVMMADRLYDYERKFKIGLPKIGCGLGGGDWSVVEKIIEETLYDFDVTIYEL